MNRLTLLARLEEDAAHFWDVDCHPAKFPYVFEEFYFLRWITALHLRKNLAPWRATE